MVERPRRGEVYWAEMGPIIGSEQGGRRPVVVVQNDTGNRFARTTIVVPVSTRVPSKPYPFQVWLADGWLPERSVAKCDQVRVIDKSRLESGRLAVLDAPTLAAMDAALHASLGLR